MSKAQFVKRSDAVCANYRPKLDRLGAQSDDAPTDSASQGFEQLILELGREQSRKLHALRLPRRNRAGATAWLDAFDAAVDQQAEYVAAFDPAISVAEFDRREQRLTELIERYGLLTEAYGQRVCGPGEDTSAGTSGVSGPGGSVDPTPERLDGSSSQEFEQDDIDRANNASDEVKDYCSGAVSEAQRVGCESHVTEDELP